MIQIAEF